MGHTIGITACAISGNKGTEAMLTTALRLLKARLPDARFVVFSYYAEKDRPLAERYPDTVVADAGPLALVTQHLPVALFERLLGWTGLHARGLLESTRRVAECDLVVDVAGIAFSDGREKYLPFNVLTVLSPLWLGVGVAKMSQALGPFRHRLNRVLARWILRQCRYVAARGELTAEHLRALGIDDAPRCPDIAFLLNELADMTALDASLADRLAFGTGERPLVGLCPSSVVFKACQPLGVDYVAVNARFVDELVRRGYRVLVLPHSQRPGTSRLKNNDLPVVERIVERATDSEEVTALTEELDAIDLRRVIGRCDLFVASRFHSMVASLAMAVPTMVCGWGHKY
ncbi:MAG: polysaccharide pyruvyl transferase family protein, partial [Planctomycetota bacterium]